jgi:hypothetical protein
MNKILTRSALCLFAACTLAACGGGGDPEPEQTLRVTVTNLTAGQPMSPLLLAVNTGGSAAWTAGASASTALEHLAEGGDATALADDLAAAGGIAQVKGTAPIGPGASESHDLVFRGHAEAKLTLAAMLVNTNDAFTGLAALPVGAMAVGEHMSRELMAWDAGTEANDETAASIPGPAGGGEGFNAARSDALDAVRIHAGVVSSDDGLASSVLKGKHRFDNPVMKVEIERIR